jgi:HEAT repeat protein
MFLKASDGKIIKDLASPEKTFRVVALEQAIAGGSSRELLAFLERMQTQEKDDECMILLQHAIEVVREKMKPLSEVDEEYDPQAIPPDEIPDIFTKCNVPNKLRILLALKNSQVSALALWASREVRREKNPAVVSQMIRIFGTYWPMDGLKTLLEKVASGYLTVRFASLEALIAIAPDRLKDSLPLLLQDQDARIRATAVKGLAKIDKEEAQNHLECILLDKDVNKKLAGLQVAVVLPFSMVKPGLLKFLSVEKDPDLLEKAGWIFQINPDPEVPYRLLELLHQTDELRLPVLKEIMEGACRIIQDSGLLDEDFPVYLKKLEESIRRYRALHVINSTLNTLDENQAEPEKVDQDCIEEKDKALVREALQAPMPISITAVQKKCLQTIVQSTPAPPSPAKPLTAKDRKTVFLQLPDAQKVRFIAKLNAMDSEFYRESCEELGKDERAAPEVRAAVLRWAARLKIAGFEELASKWLNHSQEIFVVAGLQYLGKTDPEKTYNLIGRFLKSGSPKIRLAVFKILRDFDPMQGVSAIMAMLRASDKRNMAVAISCLMNIDFALVRDQVVEHLETSKAEALVEPVVALFQSNPHPENLFLLYRLEKVFQGPLRERICAVRNQNIALIKDLRLLNQTELNDLLGSLEQKHQSIKSKKIAPPPYSVKAIRSRQEGFFTKLRETMIESSAPLAVISLFFLFIGSIFWVGLIQESTASKKKVSSRSLLAAPLEIDGTVVSVIPEGQELRIEGSEQTLYQLRQNARSQHLRVGDRVKAIILPFRFIDGVVFARFQTVEKL